MELLLSIVVASATLIYTVVTIFQLAESRKNRLLKEAPSIIPFLKSSEDHKTMELIIKNFGEGVAKNVRVEFTKDVKRFDKDFGFSEIGISKHGLNIFPPQYQLKYFVGFFTKIYETNNKDFVEIGITYENLNNRKFKTHFKLPFNQIFGQNYSTPPETYMGQIPYYLKEINSTLKKNIDK